MKEERPKKDIKKEDKSEWDKRKIFLTFLVLFVLLFIGYEAKNLFLEKSTFNPQINRVSGEDVKGASVSRVQSQGIKDTIQESINNIKNEATSINISDIATSSPQIQKVINDLKAIQNYPSSEIKNACLKICNGL